MNLRTVLFKRPDSIFTTVSRCAAPRVLSSALLALIATGSTGLRSASASDAVPARDLVIDAIVTLQVEGAASEMIDAVVLESTDAPTAVDESERSVEGASAPAETAQSSPEGVPASVPDPPPSSPPAPSSSTVAEAPVRPPYGVGKYTVAKGDTMFSISRKVGLSLATLAAANNIADPNSVKAGTVLYIPSVAGAVHQVNKGDSVQSLSARYEVKSESIREANRLDQSAKLEAGQLLVIPGTVRASAEAIRPLQPQTASQVVLPPTNPSVSPAPAPKSVQPTIESPPPSQKGLLAAVGDTLIWSATGPISTTFIPTHRGLDIVAPQGTPAKAALAGKVVGAAEGDGPYGWYVMLQHGGGFTTMYAHLSKIRVEVGDTVTKGQVIGEVGSTGRSTGPHLHFELRQNNVPIDPRPYLP